MILHAFRGGWYRIKIILGRVEAAFLNAGPTGNKIPFARYSPSGDGIVLNGRRVYYFKKPDIRTALRRCEEVKQERK
jgi:hypothetical protein